MNGPASERLGPGAWTPRDLAVLAVVVALNEMVALGINLVVPGLGPMAAALHTAHVVWVITLYALVGAVVAPVVGRLADLHGKRRCLLAATVCAVVGPVIVALSQSIAVALAGRAVQGASLAVVPLSYSLLRDVMPARLVTTAVSVATTGFGLISIVGPFLAGYLIDHHGYRSVFWFLGALGLALVAVAAAVLPESPVRGVGSVDRLGALGLATGSALVLVWISTSPAAGWLATRSLALLASGVATLLVWWWHNNRVTEPLVSPVLLRRRRVVALLGSGAVSQGGIAAAASLMPMMVMTPAALGLGYGFGDTALGVSRYSVPAGVTTMLGGYLLGRRARRDAARGYFAGGCLLLALASVGLAVAHARPAEVVTAFVVLGLGAGLCYAAVPTIVLALTDDTEQGVMAGTASLVQSLGASAGVQLAFAVLGAHVVRVVGGQPVYADAGFTAAYLVCAGLVGLGAVSVACIGRVRVARSVESVTTE